MATPPRITKRSSLKRREKRLQERAREYDRVEREARKRRRREERAERPEPTPEPIRTIGRGLVPCRTEVCTALVDPDGAPGGLCRDCRARS